MFKNLWLVFKKQQKINTLFAERRRRRRRREEEEQQEDNIHVYVSCIRLSASKVFIFVVFEH